MHKRRGGFCFIPATTFFTSGVSEQKLTLQILNESRFEGVKGTFSLVSVHYCLCVPGAVMRISWLVTSLNPLSNKITNACGGEF